MEYLLNEDAPEPVYEEMKAGAGKEQGQGVNIRRRKRIALALIAIGILAAVLYSAIFFSRDEKPIPMDGIEGGEIYTGSDFELEW